jgi:hypothetical protein
MTWHTSASRACRTSFDGDDRQNGHGDHAHCEAGEHQHDSRDRELDREER